MQRGAQWVTVHRVTKSWTRLSDFHFHSSSQMVLVLKNSPANAGDKGDAGLIPRLDQRRSPREGHGNLLQYSCLENPMDRGAWRAIVHRVAKSQTRLKWLSIQVELMFLALGFPQNLGKIPSSMSKHSPLLCTSQFCPVYFSSFLV